MPPSSRNVSCDAAVQQNQFLYAVIPTWPCRKHSRDQAVEPSGLAPGCNAAQFFRGKLHRPIANTNFRCGLDVVYLTGDIRDPSKQLAFKHAGF